MGLVHLQTRSTRFYSAVVASSIQQVLIVAGGLWFAPFVLRHVGRSNYAYWLAAMQALQWLALLEFGALTLLPRNVARAVGEEAVAGSSHPVVQAIGRGMGGVLRQVPVIAVVSFGCYWLIPKDWEPVRGPAIWILAANALVMPLHAFPAILNGFQDQAYVSFLGTIGWLLNIGVASVMLARGGGFQALAVGWIVSQFIPQMLAAARVYRRYPEFRAARVDLGASSGLGLGPNFWIFVNRIAFTLRSGIDVLLMQRLSTNTNTVRYAMTGRLGNFATLLPNAATQFLVVSISQLKGERNAAGVDRLAQLSIQGSLLVSGALWVGLLAVNRSFVSAWVGRDLYGGSVLTALFGAILVTNQLGFSISAIGLALGLERTLALTNLAEGICIAGTAPFLIARLGPVGMAVSILAGGLLIRLPFNMYWVLRTGTGELRRALLRHVQWLWRLLPALAAATLIAMRSPSLPILQVLLLTIGTLLLYAFCMVSYARSEPLGGHLQAVLARVRARWSAP